MFDLDLAYARARDELVAQPITGRALVARPLELELAEVDLASWLADLSRRLEDASYRAGPITIYDAPKGAGLVRPASQITLEDRVAYTAAVGACLPAIDAATRWSQGKTDFAMRLDPAKLQHRKWFRSPFKGWSEFNERSLRYLNRTRTTDVVLGDIAGYFENISLELLRSDLERIGCPSPAVSVIERCLREWAQSPDRGLPQGVLASDVLAKLYLESLDRALLNAGLRHVRYVDDVRIFCDSPEVVAGL